MVSLKLASLILFNASTYPSVSPGLTRYPSTPSWIKFKIPPAAHPTTGTPLAILSKTTNPSVSESLGIINASAEAKEALNSSPLNCPVKTVFVPLKCSCNSSACGPPPTIHKRAFGILSKTGLISINLFSAPSLPTYTMRKSSGFPSVIFILMSSVLNSGLKRTVSIPFLHTSTLGTPLAVSSSFICGEVHRVRSARECTQRRSHHANSSWPGNMLR
mmetsp:Transcript_3213/g.4955  ORF Transcript_3213/g.4955 Transcript_3213/m.4955 type:complete len:217 (+) Transcript_3213:394-1044(+)